MTTVFALMHVNVSKQATQHCLIREQTEAMQLERSTNHLKRHEENNWGKKPEAEHQV